MSTLSIFAATFQELLEERRQRHFIVTVTTTMPLDDELRAKGSPEKELCSDCILSVLIPKDFGRHCS